MPASTSCLSTASASSRLKFFTKAHIYITDNSIGNGPLNKNLFKKFKFNKLKFKNTFREVFLRRTDHYDGYDFWINYANKGSVNQWHNHEGYLSGVIYLKNTKNSPTLFKESNIEYGGDVGEICIFPASLEHSVGEYLQDDERITASFNLVWEEGNYGG